MVSSNDRQRYFFTKNWTKLPDNITPIPKINGLYTSHLPMTSLTRIQSSMIYIKYEFFKLI